MLVLSLLSSQNHPRLKHLALIYLGKSNDKGWSLLMTCFIKTRWHASHVLLLFLGKMVH